MKNFKIIAFAIAALVLAAVFVYVQLPPSTQAVVASANNTKAQNKEVVMYATAWCPYCQKAREFFAANNIAYTEYDIEKDSRAYQHYQSLGGRGIPLIYIDEQRLSGFDETRLRTMYYGK